MIVEVAEPPKTSGNASGDTALVLRLVDQFQQALQRFDRAALVDSVTQLLAHRATMGAQWQAVAQVAANVGELSLARRAMDAFVEASGHTPMALYQRAALLSQIGAAQEAYDQVASLPDSVPDPASNAYSKGTTLLTLGRADEAKEQLDKVAQLRPHSGSAWFALSQVGNLARDEALGDRIIAAERGMANAFPAEGAVYYYALGKVHADRGEHALAFAAFDRGAKLQKSLVSYDRDADQQDAEAAIRGYDPAAIGGLARQQSAATGRAIFVNGLPRSGTTLIEQILTSHTAISGGGEINRLDLLAREIGGKSFDAVERYVQAGGGEKAALLWDHWLTESFPAAGHVVDKTVNTSRHLGMVASLLPEAKLIWVTRDPADRAWSCFRTYFLGTMPWSYDLEDIAYHFALDDWLLERWQDMLGDRILVVPYEALVTDFEPSVRRILAHCGLPEEPAPFSPHENDRAVTTASVMQVRRPINRDALGASEPYRQFLEPFRRAYSPR